jgi:hypothetical protein
MVADRSGGMGSCLSRLVIFALPNQFPPLTGEDGREINKDLIGFE